MPFLCETSAWNHPRHNAPTRSVLKIHICGSLCQPRICWRVMQLAPGQLGSCRLINEEGCVQQKFWRYAYSTLVKPPISLLVIECTPRVETISHSFWGPSTHSWAWRHLPFTLGAHRRVNCVCLRLIGWSENPCVWSCFEAVSKRSLKDRSKQQPLQHQLSVKV